MAKESIFKGKSDNGKSPNDKNVGICKDNSKPPGIIIIRTINKGPIDPTIAPIITHFFILIYPILYLYYLYY